MLGIVEEDASFDQTIIMHINSAFMILTQLNVGPKEGFSITSDIETWEDFIGASKNLEAIKTYIYLKVKIAFDPPSSSFVQDSMINQIKEYEFRLNIQAESEV